MRIIGGRKVPVVSDQSQSLQHVDFVTYLLSHPQESIVDLVNPYNDFDAVLRQIYAQTTTSYDSRQILNLRSPFDNSRRVSLFPRLLYEYKMFSGVIKLGIGVGLSTCSMLGFGWLWSVIRR